LFFVFIYLTVVPIITLKYDVSDQADRRRRPVAV